MGAAGSLTARTSAPELAVALAAAAFAAFAPPATAAGVGLSAISGPTGRTTGLASRARPRVGPRRGPDLPGLPGRYPPCTPAHRLYPVHPDLPRRATAAHVPDLGRLAAVRHRARRRRCVRGAVGRAGSVRVLSAPPDALSALHSGRSRGLHRPPHHRAEPHGPADCRDGPGRGRTCAVPVRNRFRASGCWHRR